MDDAGGIDRSPQRCVGGDFINLSDKGPFTTLAEARTAGAATLNYGVFLNEVINFLIVALAVFVLIKAINTARKKFEKQQAAAPPGPTVDQKLLMEIRDTLKQGR